MHEPSSHYLSLPHLTSFVCLKCTLWFCVSSSCLPVPLWFWKAVFSAVSLHICPYGSHVWGAAGALELLRHAGPNRQHVWAQGLARMTWGWFPQDGLQWGLQQPEGQRNDKNILYAPPSTYLPPSALSLSMLQCLFSGRPGFLRDGAVDERRKRGLGQRGKDRHRERWMGMGRQSCARSGFGGVCRVGCFLEAGRESEDRGGQSTNLSLRLKSDFFASRTWECEQSRLAGSSSGLNLRENISILWICRNHKGIWTWSFVLSHAWKTNSALHWAKYWANVTISTGRGHQQT